jgi:Rad3-related DNA helicase
MSFTYNEYFPYPSIRDQQSEAIDFILDSFINKQKRFVILEAGTGVGKSAVGLTIARYMAANFSPKGESIAGGCFLTTQKILQQQYVDDFGGTSGPMKSIMSSTNYKCNYNKKTTCAESLRALRTTEKGSPFWRACTFNCKYRKTKDEFIQSSEGVTNFPYFLAETQYAGKLKPRQVLIVDEAHNACGELSKFIEVTLSDKFCKDFLKFPLPTGGTPLQYVKWVKDTYIPAAASKLRHVEQMMEKYVGLKDKIRSGEFASAAKKFEMLDKHVCKMRRFLKLYSADNWVLNEIPADGRSGRKIEFKPIDVAPFSNEMLLNYGDHVLLMSATILDAEAFVEMLGIPKDQYVFISMPTPFPVENRPIFYSGMGKMSSKTIEETLPKMAQAVKAILEQHKNEKGIIHCHSYRIVNYLKKNIRNKRLLSHNSDNRDATLKKHRTSKSATVLLSPSMTEGVDLHGDLSRFQIICKIPYPYLGDKLIRKKMNKWKWWYPLQTAKTIVQGTGRSVRSLDDTAVTYILDSDWEIFYNRNRNIFPDSFRESLK